MSKKWIFITNHLSMIDLKVDESLSKPCNMQSVVCHILLKNKTASHEDNAHTLNRGSNIILGSSFSHFENGATPFSFNISCNNVSGLA